jgi:hypothetical protein
MPNTERSYADRLLRGRTMQSHIEGFSPTFAPTDSNLAPVAFESYLNGCETANDEVSTAEVAVTDAANTRRSAADDIKDKALRVTEHVRANAAWKKWLPAVERASKLVRGVALPKRVVVETPEGEEPPPPAKVRMGAKSQLGFGDIEKNFGKLISAVQKITGYTAAAGSGLLVADLNTQRDAYSVLNQTCTDAETDLDDKQRERAGFFDGEGGCGRR